MRAARGGRSDRLLRGQALAFEESVHGPVNAVERTVRHAVRTEAQRDPHPEDLAERIVRDKAFGPQPALIYITRAAPLTDEVWLARCHDSRGFRPTQDLVIRKFVVFDPMPRILSGRGVLNRLERLDGEADRGIADRMGRGLETGTVRRGEDGTKLGWRVNEDPPLSRPSDVWSREGGGVGPERAVHEDLNRAEPEPRIPEPRSESRIHERRQHRVVRHRVHSEAEGPRAAGALVRGPAGSGHDIVNRCNPEAMGHSRNGGAAVPGPHPCGPDPPMELPERVLRQDARGTAGGVDLEAPRASQIRRELEGLRIQRSEVAVDSACDDGVVGRHAIEVLSEEETPLRPLRLVPIDSDNPVPQTR